MTLRHLLLLAPLALGACAVPGAENAGVQEVALREFLGPRVTLPDTLFISAEDNAAELAERLQDLAPVVLVRPPARDFSQAGPGPVDQHRAIVYASAPERKLDGSVTVEVSFYVHMLHAYGQDYVLRQSGGQWEVVEVREAWQS